MLKTYFKMNMRNAADCYMRKSGEFFKSAELFELHTPGWRLLAVNAVDGWLYFIKET
jgi:hypothetical protein